MKAWGCFIYSILFFAIILGEWFILGGTIGTFVAIALGCMWLYGLIAIIVSDDDWEDDSEQRDEYLSGDDFVALKVGEWITRK